MRPNYLVLRRPEHQPQGPDFQNKCPGLLVLRKLDAGSCGSAGMISVHQSSHLFPVTEKRSAPCLSQKDGQHHDQTLNCVHTLGHQASLGRVVLIIDAVKSNAVDLPIFMSWPFEAAVHDDSMGSHFR